MYDRQKSYQVHELNALIKRSLESEFFLCSVVGEISNLARPQSGHLYFSLKDELAVIRGVMWRSTAQHYRHLIENGAKVTMQGSISLYSPRGEYQLIVRHVEPFGVGDLHQRYEALKERLATEGLFHADRKRAVKLNPKAIGIITSENAAALQDVRNVLQAHRPDIPHYLYPALVQGDQAADSIVQAIERANRECKVDVLLIVRGGGSIEDLWPFNEERVARALAASVIPTISGVGHETDHTIVDFVADMRGATPSVAARLSAISREELFQHLDQQAWRLTQLIQQRLNQQREMLKKRLHQLERLEPEKSVLQSAHRLSQLEQRLRELSQERVREDQHRLAQLGSRLNSVTLQHQVNQLAERVNHLQGGLIKGVEKRWMAKEGRLMQLVGRLESLSPLNVLKRGYSLTYYHPTDQRRILLNREHPLKPGDRITVETDALEVEAEVIQALERIPMSD